MRRRSGGEAGRATRLMNSLRLIVGPPNSGRTGATLDGFRAAAARDPVLVVPTVDDVERFEEELTREGDAVVGATVGNFAQLFGLVARATDAPAGPAVSRTQRLRLAREAASRAELRILAASSRRPGFPAALEELVSELQAALVDPGLTNSRSPRSTRATCGFVTSSASTTSTPWRRRRPRRCARDPRRGARDRSSSMASMTSPSSSSSWSASSTRTRT
jgi:hypothetical protein